MKSKIALLLTVAFISSKALFAHALWIETSATGTKGKSQEVKIFFGEFSDKDITPAAKWFSDLKDFSLVLITPDKQAINLSAVAKTDYYTAAFTPSVNGVYTLVMHHIVKDVYGTMMLDYNSSATVVVGNQFEGNDAYVNNNIISLFAGSAFSARQNKNVTIKAIYEGKPAAKQEMKVFAPNGWGKELYSDEKGEFSFMPIWPGKYMVEFAYTDKTPGEHNGKPYNEVWKMATYLIIVQ